MIYHMYEFCSNNMYLRIRVALRIPGGFTSRSLGQFLHRSIRDELRNFIFSIYFLVVYLDQWPFQDPIDGGTYHI